MFDDYRIIFTQHYGQTVTIIFDKLRINLPHLRLYLSQRGRVTKKELGQAIRLRCSTAVINLAANYFNEMEVGRDARDVCVSQVHECLYRPYACRVHGITISFRVTSLARTESYN